MIKLCAHAVWLILLVSLTFFEGSALAEPSSSAAPPMIQIDKIEVSGATTMTPGELGPYLDLPLGQDISLITASEHLSEATNILAATGRFKDNMQLKLERSFKTQHYIIKATLEDVSSRYLGIRASYGRYVPDDNLGTYDSYRFESYGLNLYWGDRDFNKSGWGLDLNAQGDSERDKFSATDDTSTHNEFKGKSRNDRTVGTITTINQNLLGGRGYMGFELSSAFNTYSDKWSSKHIGTDTRETQYSYQADYVQYRAESFWGVKFGKTSLGAGVSRTMTRVLKTRSKAFTTVNGEPQPESLFFPNSLGEYRFDTRAALSASYSDKPKLNIVEPGIDVRANIGRTYYADAPGNPLFFVNGEYTRFVQPSLALTCLHFSSWSFGDRQWSRSVTREHELGLRVDYITEKQYVVYGEFTRFGGLRREINYSEHFDGLTLKSHAEIGVIHASSDMLYGLSFVYMNARPTVDGTWSSNLTRNTGYERLGGR